MGKIERGRVAVSRRWVVRRGKRSSGEVIDDADDEYQERPWVEG